MEQNKNLQAAQNSNSNQPLNEQSTERENVANDVTGNDEDKTELDEENLDLSEEADEDELNDEEEDTEDDEAGA